MTETVMRTDGAAIGRADRRKEDGRLLTGRTNWTDNIQLPGTLHMACLRSSMAHAKILGIDASAALALEGVVHVYTGKDLSRDEELRLRQLAETIIVKDVRSPERLLDETALFLHRVESKLPPPKREMLRRYFRSPKWGTSQRMVRSPAPTCAWSLYLPLPLFWKERNNPP